MPEYQQEVSIYDSDSILKKFTSQETAISVVQGNISALISSSELTELINGGKTMYSQLMKVNLAINSFKIDISELTTKYTNVSDSYLELSSKMSTFEVSLDTISGKVSSTENSLSDIKSTVAEHTTSLTGINSSISSLQSEQSGMSSRLNSAEQKITPDAITSTVTSSTVYKDSLSGKVDTKNIISTINQTAEGVCIDASKISLNGVVTANENFKILLDGSIVAKSAKIIGGEINIATNDKSANNSIKISRGYNKFHHVLVRGDDLWCTEDEMIIVDEYGMSGYPCLRLSSRSMGIGQLIPNGTATNPVQYNSYFYADYKGDVECRSLRETSDARLKEVVGHLEYNFASDLIMSITPIEYKWKKSEAAKKHMGVTAQNIEQILGDSYGIVENKSGKYTLGYTELIAPLISMVQEHERKLENLLRGYQ